MSDQFFGKITIGGRLKRADFPSFLKAINADYYDDTLNNEKDLLGYVSDNTLELSSGQASNGQYDAIENFCRDHGLPYDRSSESYGEYNSEAVYWRPGMSEPASNYADKDGYVTVTCDKLRTWIADLQKFIKKVKTVEGAPLKINSKNEDHAAWARHVLAKNKIDPLELLTLTLDTYNPIASPLPAFEIVS